MFHYINLQTRDGTYTVADFMTRKANLLVVEPTTTVDKGMHNDNFKVLLWKFTG